MDKKLFQNKYRIKSCRLPGWNYSGPGYYFITICTKNMIHFFGKIKNGEIILSGIGEIIHDEWLKTEQIRSNVTLDEFIIMPNHVHGIIIINGNKTRSGNMTSHDDDKTNYGNMDVKTWRYHEGIHRRTVETHCNASLQRGHAYIHHNGKFERIADQHINKFGPQRNNVPSIIRGFKSTCTKKINLKYGPNNFAWQSRYYDHVIRDDTALYNIKQYIINNPKKWWFDQKNLPNLYM